MHNMGSWVLAPFGVALLTTNQAESFNATMKRFQNWKKLPLDMMVVSFLRLDEFFAARIARGHYGLDDYKLRKHLQKYYPSEGAVIPKQVTMDQLLERIKNSRSDYFRETSVC